MAEKKIDFAEEFGKLLALDVNEHTEKLTQGYTSLTYLSWTYAIAEATKADPNMEYEIELHDGKPYIYDELTGYLVTTKVTMFGKTKMMWLPVMDSANHAMKSTPYEIQTKSRVITVAPATMFDINKTIMRCLVKNFAMFGLGLYIYAGEDLPKDMQNVAEKLDVAIKEACKCRTRDELNVVWKNYAELQSNEEFIKCVKTMSAGFNQQQSA